jgi:putative SOS response-associated peptidase YedK
MLYDNWRAKGKPSIDGAAAITFDPTPEVAAAGHNRTVGRLKAENADAFLRAKEHSIAEHDAMIDDHEEFHFKAALVAA